MQIMKEYSHKYYNQISDIINLNILKKSLQSEISNLYKLKKENLKNKEEYYIKRIIREKKIKKLEDKLFTKGSY